MDRRWQQDTLRYTLIRSRRKTVAIHITKNAELEVRAPLRASTAAINAFVAAKEKWIRRHLEERQRSVREKSSFSLSYGGQVTLLGKRYPICAGEESRAWFDGLRFWVPPGLPPEQIKNRVTDIYKAEAKRRLWEKTAVFGAQMRVCPAAVTISGARTRWGSCSGRNRLSFSWRLMMADEDAVDYVVVHELAHIREHNHSRRFWAVVEQIMPDYKRRKLTLKTLQDTLSREDWP